MPTVDLNIKHVLVFGPVSAEQMKAKLNIPPAWRVTCVNHAPIPPGTNFLENGSAAFAYLVGQINGDILEHYCPGDKHIVIGSFSAGHGALEWIFNQLGGDPRIVGVCCGDSYYCDKATMQARKAKPGYLRQAQVAANGGASFMMTSSLNAGPGYVSSSEATSILAEKIGAKSEQTDFPKSYMKGFFAWTDMGNLWTHKEHATLGLPEMINATVEGYESAWNPGKTTPTPAPGQTGDSSSMLTIGLLAAAAFFAFKGK